MPIDTGTRLDHGDFGALFHHTAAPNLRLENQGLDIPGNHQIAATTQHKFRGLAQERIGQNGQDVCLATDTYQAVRTGDDVEGVERLQGHLVFD